MASARRGLAADDFLARIFSSVASVALISPAVVFLPKLNRIADFSRAGPNFIARKTWLGSTLPALQAEPLLTAIPCRSRLITSAKLSKPGKERFKIPGMRCCGWLLSVAPG